MNDTCTRCPYGEEEQCEIVTAEYAEEYFANCAFNPANAHYKNTCSLCRFLGSLAMNDSAGILTIYDFYVHLSPSSGRAQLLFARYDCIPSANISCSVAPLWTSFSSSSVHPALQEAKRRAIEWGYILGGDNE